MKPTLKPNSKNPPGPIRSWFGLPWLFAMRKDYLAFIQSLQRNYGDITYLSVFREAIVDIHSPELTRNALVENASNLIRWPRVIEIFSQGLGSENVLMAEGAKWQRLRRMLQPGFTPRRCAAYAQLMVDAARTSLDRVVPQGQSQAIVDVDTLTNTITMDVILRTLFSKAAPDDVANAARATRLLSELALSEMFQPFTLPMWVPTRGNRNKRWAILTLKNLITGEIADRKRRLADNLTAVPHNDLLAMLLDARDEGAADSQSLTVTELQDQCVVMFQAGHETSATALLWWCRLMAQHPDAASKAYDEVKQVLGGRDPTPDDCPKLDWLSATLKEAMRLYPPIPVLMSRHTQQTAQIGPWTIAPKTMVRFSPWVIHHDPRWFPDPTQYRPERFTQEAPPIERGAYIPFGTGPRVCIGQHFAMLEMTLIAAMLVQRYHISLLNADEPMPETHMAVTLRPATPVRLQFAIRS